jgi:DNA-binding FadR family transcriptional regulator
VKTALRVARHVIRDIVEQDLRPGTRLPSEAVLMDSYDVSRSSMREALRILETNGFISVRPGPGGGPVVNSVQPGFFGQTTAMFLQMSRTTLLEVFDARKMIEPLLVKVGTELQLPGPMDELRIQLQRHQAFAEYDHTEYDDITQGFHEVICRLAGNNVLELFANSLRCIVRDRVAPVRQSSNRWSVVIGEHVAIGQAILAGRATKAQALMDAHMAGFRDGYRQRYPSLIDQVIDGD